jgi:hypothetical protein
MYSSTHCLTSALDGGEWSDSRRGRFTPRERAPGTHWLGSWVGPRAVLGAVVKRKIPSPRHSIANKSPHYNCISLLCRDLVAFLSKEKRDIVLNSDKMCCADSRLFYLQLRAIFRVKVCFQAMDVISHSEIGLPLP